MGRPLRIEFEGGVYHITSRGNEKKEIFFDNEDRKQFLSIIREEKKRYQIILYSYVMMNNHYHLLIETPLGNLVKFMHAFNSRYTGYFNRHHNRIGHLFQGRYKAIIVDKESYLLELVRYIHLNPVRGGLDFVNYEWNSYNEYIEKNNKTIVDRDFILNQFSEDEEKAIIQFIKFHEDGIKMKKSILERVVAGTFLGSERFVEKMKMKIKENIVLTEEIQYKKELEGTVTKERILELIKSYYKISDEELRKRTWKLTEPQKVGIYLIRKYTDEKIKEIAKEFGNRDYTYIPKVINAIESEKEKGGMIAERVKYIEKELSSFKT